MRTTWMVAAALALNPAPVVLAQSTVRISVSPSGAPGDKNSYLPATSADGRYVAFTTLATNILSVPVVPGGVVLFDRLTGQRELISVDPSNPTANEGYGAAISADGRYVAYLGALNGMRGAIVRDRLAHLSIFINVRSDGTAVSEPGSWYAWLTMTPDGRYVAFESSADLIGDGATIRHAYVHDRDADGDGVFDAPGAIKTVRVSVASSGVAGNAETRYMSISATGRFVTYTSYASNLVAGDTNGTRDVFVHDRDSDGDGVFDEQGAISTERINVGFDGMQTADADGGYSSISEDGRFVVFQSASPDLVPDDNNSNPDIFMRDRQLQQTTCISRTVSGQIPAVGASWIPRISRDGRLIAFACFAPDVLPSDSNGGAADILVYDRLNRSRKLVSYTVQNVQGNGVGPVAWPNLIVPVLSDDGRFVAFADHINSDMAAPPSLFKQVFLRDRGSHHFADVDGAGAVNVADLIAVVMAWGPCTPPAACPADLNGDGTVNVTDLLTVITNWG